MSAKTVKSHPATRLAFQREMSFGWGSDLLDREIGTWFKWFACSSSHSIGVWTLLFTIKWPHPAAHPSPSPIHPNQQHPHLNRTVHLIIRFASKKKKNHRSFQLEYYLLNHPCIKCMQLTLCLLMTSVLTCISLLELNIIETRCASNNKRATGAWLWCVLFKALRHLQWNAGVGPGVSTKREKSPLHSCGVSDGSIQRV